MMRLPFSSSKLSLRSSLRGERAPEVALESPYLPEQFLRLPQGRGERRARGSRVVERTVEGNDRRDGGLARLPRAVEELPLGRGEKKITLPWIGGEDRLLGEGYAVEGESQVSRRPHRPPPVGAAHPWKHHLRCRGHPPRPPEDRPTSPRYRSLGRCYPAPAWPYPLLPLERPSCGRRLS